MSDHLGILRQHNLWRRGDIDESQHSPTEIGLAIDAAIGEIERLRAEAERLRMQLAACGVVAMSNTAESAELNRKMHPDHMSASCQDVMRAVDREMELRAEVEALRKDADLYRALRAMHWDSSPLAVIREPKRNARLGSDCPSMELLDAAIAEAAGLTVGVPGFVVGGVLGDMRGAGEGVWVGGCLDPAPAAEAAEPPANCRQRLAVSGKPYPRSSCSACGKFSPKWRECDVVLAAALIAAAGNGEQV